MQYLRNDEAQYINITSQLLKYIFGMFLCSKPWRSRLQVGRKIFDDLAENTT